MCRQLTLALALLVSSATASDNFAQMAESKIRELVKLELWGHYDVESVSVVATKDHTGEWGGLRNDYGLKTVVAQFEAVRNASWNEKLNRNLSKNCDQAGSVYLLCQPPGHRFIGKLEVDMAFTTDGWRILGKNYRSLREFVLSKYLVLEGRPKEGYVLPPKQSAH